MSLLFNTLSRFVIAFWPRSNHLLISWLQSPSTVILETRKRKFSTISPSICYEGMGPDAMILSESESEVTQSCLTLGDPMDCSLPGSSVHGILPARILEWVAISFSRGSSLPRDQTWVSRLRGRSFNL